MTNSSLSQSTTSPPRSGKRRPRAGLARGVPRPRWRQHGWGRGALGPLAGTGRGDGEAPGWAHASEDRETDHPELGQQSHAEESQVVEQEADTVCLAQLEALRGHRHEGEDQAQTQRSGEDPDQEAVRLQLPERWGATWGDARVLLPA